MGWKFDGDGEQANPRGRDAEVWHWPLISEAGENRMTVEVAITGSAMSAGNVPPLVEEARRTQGQSVVAGVLGWDRPPEGIKLHSESMKPEYEGGDPGAEVRELNEIADWFDDRRLAVVFTAGGYGHSPDTVNWLHNVTIYDIERDEVALRVAGKPSRLEALREAKAQWEASREQKPKTVHGSPSLTGTGKLTASGEVRPGGDAKARLHALGYFVFVSRTSEAEDAYWQGELYDRDWSLVAVQVAGTLDDLWLVLADDVLPEENR